MGGGGGVGGRMVRWCWVSLQCRGVLIIGITEGQGPTALAVGAGEGCLDILYAVLSVCPSVNFSCRPRIFLTPSKTILKLGSNTRPDETMYFSRTSTVSDTKRS